MLLARTVVFGEMKIQISEGTKALLAQYGEKGKYAMQQRGSIPVKGKGDLNTHWLTRGITIRAPKYRL